MKPKSQESLEKIIGVYFKDRQLLKNAFIHRSYLNENKSFDLPANEKLEFLGDSVLSLITSIYLYKKYPKLHEGEYTNIKAAIVKTESLSEAAEKIDLGKYLYLSKGEDENKGRSNTSILADTFEALIAVIFLEHGFEEAYEFVLSFLFHKKLDDIVSNNLYSSAKNTLQEIVQEKYKKLPDYRILEETGPEHKKEYKIGVYFEEKLMGTGVGNSKKHAEEQAARSALQKLGV